MEYVRELLEAVPTSANVKYYANIVSEKAVLRKLIKASEEVANSCYLEKDSTEMILEESEKKLFQVLQRNIGGDFVPIQQVVLNAINNIEKGVQTERQRYRITHGIRRPGLQNVRYARLRSGTDRSPVPSMGKTAFVLNIAQYMAFRRGHHSGDIQSGDVQRTAGKPTACHGISCRFTEYAYRKSER